MSNSAVVRALRRRYNFYFNTPIFNKYGRSLRDFLGVTSMALGALLLMLFVLVLFTLDLVCLKFANYISTKLKREMESI